MIRTDTVLVLGAGASRPYNFVTAAEIVKRARPEQQRNDIVRWIHQHTELPFPPIQDFFDLLHRSGVYSIDTFLQRCRPDPDMKLIGKATILSQLLPVERQPLVEPPEEEDWCRYVFSRMFPKERGVFAANQLKVITFNFDHSFERKLHEMFAATYGVTEAEAIEQTRTIQVLHIHGELSALDASGREDVRSYVENIRIIDEEIPAATLHEARVWLREAQRVCFVGFSFHEDNLRRLDAAHLGTKAIWASALGMSDADRARVYAYFGSPRKDYLLNRSARALFDVVDLF